jgi:hypothetical protein
MITPILISSINWGTYLFFAVSKPTSGDDCWKYINEL